MGVVENRDHPVELRPLEDSGDRSPWCVEEKLAAQLTLTAVGVGEHTDTGAVHELGVAEIDENHSPRVKAIEHPGQLGSRGAVELSDHGHHSETIAHGCP